METILFTIENNIAYITLNRPEKYNAFTREMALLMQQKLEACTSDKNIRCVYIIGAGKAFSAGQDLDEVADVKGRGMNRILSEQFNPIVSKIKRLQKPVVAAVNGVAAGAGANIALACDIVIASRSASFIQAFSKIGLVPDTGGTFILPRLIGWQKATALMMLGDKVMAEEAERMGMIYKWMEDDLFENQSKELAAKLAAMPTTALALTKQALYWSETHAFREQLENEDKLQQRAAATKDFKEGLKAFMEKRKPNFTGE